MNHIDHPVMRAWPSTLIGGAIGLVVFGAGMALAAPPQADPPTETTDAPAEATEAPTEDPNVVPTVLHTPVSSVSAGRTLTLKARVVGDWQLSKLSVHYRPEADARADAAPKNVTWRQAAIERTRDGAWQARIPAEAVDAVGLAYYIESEAVDGTVRRHFASPEDPHPVRVLGRSPTDVQRDQLARYDGARSRVRVDGWLVAYGAQPQDDGQSRTDRFSDRLWQAEAEYIFRPLTLLHDMRFGFGLMRGEWPAVDDTPVRDADTPGLNYGYGEINLELHRWFSVGGRLILGASGVGFTAGVGGVARVGDISGTHFEARISTIGDIGTSTALGFRWDTVPRFPMGLGIEFTDWPAGGADAANLIYDVGFEVDDRWTVNAKVGSTGRSNSLDGGFQAGMGLMADF